MEQAAADDDYADELERAARANVAAAVASTIFAGAQAGADDDEEEEDDYAVCASTDGHSPQLLNRENDEAADEEPLPISRAAPIASESDAGSVQRPAAAGRQLEPHAQLEGATDLQHHADDDEDDELEQHHGVEGEELHTSLEADAPQFEDGGEGDGANDLYDAQYDSDHELPPEAEINDGRQSTSHTGKVSNPYYGSDYDSDQPLVPATRKRARGRQILDDGPPTQVKQQGRHDDQATPSKKSRRKATSTGYRRHLSADQSPQRARGRRRSQARRKPARYAHDWSDEDEFTDMVYPTAVQPISYGRTKGRGQGRRGGIRPAGPGNFYSIIPVAPASKADRVCPVCGRGPFKDWSRYHRHAIQHAPSRGRPYGCDICGHSFFRTAAQLKHHMKMVCGVTGALDDGEDDAGDAGGEAEVKPVAKRDPPQSARQASTSAAADGADHRQQHQQTDAGAQKKPQQRQQQTVEKKTAGVKPSPLTRLLMKSGTSAKAHAVATKQQNDAVLMPEIKRIQSQQRLMIRAGRKGRLATDVCSMCGRYFRDRDEHMRMHTADPSRPYQCSLCKMAYFETVRSAQRHLFWCAGGRRKKRCRGDIGEKRQQELDQQQSASGTLVEIRADPPQQSAPQLQRAPMTADELMNSVLSMSGIGTGAPVLDPAHRQIPAAGNRLSSVGAGQRNAHQSQQQQIDVENDFDADRSSPPRLVPMVSPAQLAAAHPSSRSNRDPNQLNVKRRRKDARANVSGLMYDQPTMVHQQRHLTSACSSVPPHMSPTPNQIGQQQQQQDGSQMSTSLHGTPQPLGAHLNAQPQVNASSSSGANQQQQQQQNQQYAAVQQLQHLQQAVYNVGGAQFAPLNMAHVAFDPAALWPSNVVQHTSLHLPTTSHAGASQQQQQPTQPRMAFMCDLCQRAQFADVQALNKHKESCGLPRLLSNKH